MDLLVTDENQVRTILLHRPDRLNAFDVPLVRDLARTLEEVNGDPEISVVVLSGSGRAFSSGADLKGVAAHLAAQPTGEAPESGSQANRSAGGLSIFAGLIDALSALTKPLLIAVNGVGVGFGLTILAFADLVFMSSEARLKCPFTDIGLPPEAASTYLLPLLLGRQNAAWTLLGSEWIEADDARAMGLVWRVCKPEDLLPTTQSYAQMLAAKDVGGLVVTKRLLNASHRDAIAAAVQRENSAMAEVLQGGLDPSVLSKFSS